MFLDPFHYIVYQAIVKSACSVRARSKGWEDKDMNVLDDAD